MTADHSSKEAKNPTEPSYRLSTEQLRSIYNTRIQPAYLNKPSANGPRFVVVCAQPGAGKSRLSNRLRDIFAKAAEPAVPIDIDELRPFHSKFDNILKVNPMKMDDHTGYEAWMWKGFLLNDAQKSRNNIVMEITRTRSKQTCYNANACAEEIKRKGGIISDNNWLSKFYDVDADPQGILITIWGPLFIQNFYSLLNLGLNYVSSTPAIA